MDVAQERLREARSIVDARQVHPDSDLGRAVAVAEAEVREFLGGC